MKLRKGNYYAYDCVRNPMGSIEPLRPEIVCLRDPVALCDHISLAEKYDKASETL